MECKKKTLTKKPVFKVKSEVETNTQTCVSQQEQPICLATAQVSLIQCQKCTNKRVQGKRKSLTYMCSSSLCVSSKEMPSSTQRPRPIELICSPPTGEGREKEK